MHDRHRDWMRRARELAAAQALRLDGIVWDKKDMSVIRGHHPVWIPEEFWHQLIDEVCICTLSGLCILFVLYIHT